MARTIRKPLTLMLAILLLIGLVVPAFATELETPQEPTLESDSDPPEETIQPDVSEGTSALEPDNQQASDPPDDWPDGSIEDDFPADDENLGKDDVPDYPEGITDEMLENMTPEELEELIAAYGVDWLSTSSTTALFDYVSGSRNYSIYLSSQISVTYRPNGTDSAVTAYLKNIGWHYANSLGPDHPIYCMQPHKQFAASVSGATVLQDVGINETGSSEGLRNWSNLPAERRNAIGLILLYSDQMWDSSYSVKTSYPASNPNFPLRTATQFLIYEIVTGLRDAETFNRLSSNGYTSGDVYYNAGVANVTGFASSYNALVSKIQAHYKIPSFASQSSSSAPTYTMTGDSLSLTDSNGVLSGFSISNSNGASFSKSSNTLNVTKTGSINESTAFKLSRYMPSPENSSYVLCYLSGYQTCVSLDTPSSGNVNAYFKLKANETGNLSLTKTTEDNKNLSGWQFSIYSNAACTTLVSGPHTTNTSGKLSVSGLKPGTYWVKEIGNTNASIGSLYAVGSTNPQQVTITAGNTATVSFTNKLVKGSVQFVKETNTGSSLSGWKIGLYTDAACTRAVSGSPFTTGADGKATVSNLAPGTYYAKEVDESAANPYWEYDSSVKTVVVEQNKTASVTFNNVHYGELRIKKNAVNGSAEGWTFYILSEAGQDILRTLKTGADGYAYSGRLLPGTYTVREANLGDDTYWDYDVNVERKITVTAGSQKTVEYTNTQYGRMEFHKTTNTGHHLEGWTFIVYKDGNKIGEYSTDINGYACTGKLEPGRYIVQERVSEDVYWMGDINFHTVTVTAGETAADYWRNCELGKGVFHKTTNTGENLSGWTITVYSDAACTQEVAHVTTDDNGTAGHFLEPGIYYAKETGDVNGRFENEYWLVDGNAKQFEIKPHEDTAIEFSNTHLGKILIVKTMEAEGPLENWQFKITDSTGESITAATDVNGHLLTDTLLPGEYTVEEILPQDSPYVCLSRNPQKITVEQGKTAEVSFVNGIRTGSITIQKNDITGNPLADAQFVLEWSEDGTKWTILTTSEKLEKGKCHADGLVNGCLTTGQTGLIQWTNLYPGLYYRVTEAKAPNGYLLLDKPVFSGKLSGDKLEASFTVVNTREFTMPKTGSNMMRILTTTSTVLYALTTVTMIFLLRRKKESWE